MSGAKAQSLFNELSVYFLTPNPNQFNRLTQAIMIKPIKTAGIALLLGVVVLPSAQAQTPAQKAAQTPVKCIQKLAKRHQKPVQKPVKRPLSWITSQRHSHRGLPATRTLIKSRRNSAFWRESGRL